MNIFRRLPLSRLLIVCGLVIAIGVSATALASAVGSAPTPPAKPLAQALHDALGSGPVEGVSARVTFTNHLIEGASLAGGGIGPASGLAASPLLNGGSGRLWIARDGRVRLELQAEKGDTQIVYDGKTVQMYDASSNTVYRYVPKNEAGWTSYAPLAGNAAKTSAAIEKPAAGAKESSTAGRAPSTAKITEDLTHARQHAVISEATPANVGGQPAYTVRVSPKEGGSLIGGAELSFDSTHGVPLRAAIYAATSTSPVIELAASEVSYSAVPDSVFAFSPPANAKVEEVSLPAKGSSSGKATSEKAGEKPKTSTHGHGLATIGVLESKVTAGTKKSPAGALEGLPKVNINGASASELRTALGTILSYERAGVRYVIAGSVTPAAIEALARGL